MTRKKIVGLLAILVLCQPLGHAQISDSPLSEVIFDGADPDLSVAVIDGELYQLGDVYEESYVLGFSSQSVILKNIESAESVKCPVFESRPDEAQHKRALNFFIYKQMKSIYEAQVAYRHRFGDVYAPKIDTLVEQGLLKGFKDGIKEGYFFEIVELGQTKRLAMFPREATFRAIASPVQPEVGAYYFSVNHLGEVRYADDRFQTSWGPVWEYNDPTAVPIKKIIREVG